MTDSKGGEMVKMMNYDFARPAVLSGNTAHDYGIWQHTCASKESSLRRARKAAAQNRSKFAANQGVLLEKNIHQNHVCKCNLLCNARCSEVPNCCSGRIVGHPEVGQWPRVLPPSSSAGIADLLASDASRHARRLRFAPARLPAELLPIMKSILSVGPTRRKPAELERPRGGATARTR